MEQVINKLKARLSETLPGQDIQYRMAPFGRSREQPPGNGRASYKASAVMVLFCLDHEQNWFVPLTQRFTYPGAHSGQISLPGGKREDSDGSLRETALRECFEEIGIREDIEVTGALTSLYIPVSGYLVEPYVGVCTTPDPRFVPHEREVKDIIRLYASDLMSEELVKQGSVEIEGPQAFSIKTPYFGIGEHKVWGATAMILSEFKEVLRLIF